MIMENFNEDPKPGRLVLPLVLIGMIATTYTFINRVATDNSLEINSISEEIVETIEPDVVEEEVTTSLLLPQAKRNKVKAIIQSLFIEFLLVYFLIDEGCFRS